MGQAKVLSFQVTGGEWMSSNLRLHEVNVGERIDGCINTNEWLANIEQTCDFSLQYILIVSMQKLDHLECSCAQILTTSLATVSRWAMVLNRPGPEGVLAKNFDKTQIQYKTTDKKFT